MWFRQILDFRVKDIKFSIFVKIFIKFVQFWSKIEILWSRVKDFKFWFSLGLRISNFTNLPKSKFYKNHQILSKKFLISQILWVLGGESWFCGDHSWFDMDNKMPITTESFRLAWYRAIPLPLDEWVWKNGGPVLRIFPTKFWRREPILEILVILISTSKIWIQNLNIRIVWVLGKFCPSALLVKLQSYDKRPWRNFDFWSEFSSKFWWWEPNFGF